MASKTLKSENMTALATVLVANVAAFYVLVTLDDMLAANFSNAVKDIYKLLPAGVLAVVTVIINGIVSTTWKARIVSLRYSNPLPGSRAFSKYCGEDHRIDRSALESIYGPLPADPAEQNRLWFKIYRSVETEPRALDVHKAYLLARDLTVISLLMLVGFGAAAYFAIPSTVTYEYYLLFLASQFVATNFAARNLGARFVCTVLALKSTEK